MAITITTDPAYPTPGADVRVTFAASGGGDYVRLFLTDAPIGSTLRADLDATDAGQIAIYEGDVSGAATILGDVSGGYVFSAQEITKLGTSSYGGGFHSDAASYRTETVVSTDSATFYVGQRLTGKISLGNSHTATLVFWLWDSTIRQTTVADHGEASPRFDVPTNSPASLRAAVGDSAVDAALVALRDITATAALGDADAAAANFFTRYEAHRVSPSFHQAADSTHGITGAYSELGDITGLSDWLVYVGEKFSRHILNADSTGDVGGGDFHDPGGAGLKQDWGNALSLPGGGVFQAQAGLAELHAAYESHRTWAGHDNPDTTALTALPPLAAALSALISVHKSSAPTAPANDNPGTTLLVSSAGMSESIL